MLRLRTILLASVATLCVTAPAGATDRYDLKVVCKEKAMVATVTGPKIKQVDFTTASARVRVRNAPWTAEFGKAGKLVAKAKLTTKGNPVVRLEARSPRC